MSQAIAAAALSGESPYATYCRFLRQGRLAYQFSEQAGVAVFYPRAVSPFGIADQLQWRLSAGLGTVYSSTFVGVKDGTDYNVSLIDCDEGFRLMSRVEGIAPNEVRIGMRVALRVAVPVDADDDPYPVFEPMVEGQS
jgi:uncharacterized protein